MKGLSDGHAIVSLNEMWVIKYFMWWDFGGAYGHQRWKLFKAFCDILSSDWDSQDKQTKNLVKFFYFVLQMMTENQHNEWCSELNLNFDKVGGINLNSFKI